MAKQQMGAKNRTAVCFSDSIIFLAGAFMSLIFVWSYFSIFSPSSYFINLTGLRKPINEPTQCTGPNLQFDSPEPGFYDDPDLSYTIEKPIKNWDENRKQWLESHPTFKPGSENRIVMITGSQSKPCKNPIGDHLLLRCFKNKVDYCRIHNHDIFYSNSLLNRKMNSYWAKLPVVKAAMIAHPEAEWIWWVDSDAIFTDMEFKPPLNRYKNHNLVVHGWSNIIYGEKRSWTALNAGVFSIRNCQWSMELIDTWKDMGPVGPEYAKWGEIQRSVFKDKMFPESDDQTALIYLLYKHKDIYYPKIYLEGEYYLQGYWIGVVDGFGNVTERYLEMEQEEVGLRRRHAEKVSERYGEIREERFLKGEFGGRGSKRRAFVTHFTGCQPCSGDHNPIYDGDSCWNEMIRALNFADNQVMRAYGYVHSDLSKTSPLEPLPFDYPNEPW